ncbi:bacteriophage-related signal peptide protein [Cupriavidus necator N-1]|uniref:Bacteriophage-related signal peptide protein n=1 Tax=Cupriavidus necator (strain ATCC 43291 / DSM 13513 / CCUG 52238 / LMG 8453 / N-1) TaxID=1042878 RepID=G0ER47_CUPNN|nr:DUF2514 family protein [Cupriavidus necator]AEI76565.1 bacteriophage-related signal peptide protein [Cupriavidus necator N-1]MDX6011312.1 DUF2514 family protein [Cupriavidus necator]
MAKALEFLAAWKSRLVAAFLMVAVGAVLGGVLAWWLQGNRYERQLSECGRELAELHAEQARQVAEAVNAARLEEQRRTAAQTEIANAAIQQAEAARVDARAADTARRELLARATALANASRGPGDPATVGGGAPAATPVDLLADVLGRADARAGELAAALDASHGAGRTCERSYDALTP